MRKARGSEGSNRPFSIVSEMLDPRNRVLAEVARADDFIVGNRLVALLLAQVSENKELNAVFQDLFDPEGSEIYLKLASNYVTIGKPVNFYTVVEAARRGISATESPRRPMKSASEGVGSLCCQARRARNRRSLRAVDRRDWRPAMAREALMDDSAHERPTSAAAAALLGQMKRAVFDGSRIAVIQRDLANRVLYANAAALAMSGAAHVDELRLDQLFAGEAGRILDEETRGRRNGELGAYRVTLTRLDDPGRQVAVEVRPRRQIGPARLGVEQQVELVADPVGDRDDEVRVHHVVDQRDVLVADALDVVLAIAVLEHGRALKRLDSGERAPFNVKKGDEVIFASYAGTEIKLDGEELMIMSEEDILAVVE